MLLRNYLCSSVHPTTRDLARASAARGDWRSDTGIRGRCRRNARASHPAPPRRPTPQLDRRKVVVDRLHQPERFNRLHDIDMRPHPQRMDFGIVWWWWWWKRTLARWSYSGSGLHLPRWPVLRGA